jgi:ClpP class serine protease
MKDWGIKITFIFAGKHKVDGNPYEKLSESVKSRIQERINRIYGVFVGAVARNRSLDEGAVRSTEALTYDAKDAIEVGLADRIGSLDEEMVLFSQEIALGDEQMALDPTKDGIPQAKVDELVTAAKAEGKAEGLKEGAASATARIKTIVTSEAAKTRPNAAMKMALNEKVAAVDAESVVEMLADMPEEKATAPAPKPGEKVTGAKPNQFEQHMNESGGAKVGNGDDEDDTDVSDSGKASSSILRDFAAITGHKRKQENKAA